MLKTAVLSAVIGIAALSSLPAMADRHSHTSVGVYVGPPAFGPLYGPRYWDPYYYPYPYYAPPPVVVVPPPAPPPVYIEQAPAPAPAPQASAPAQDASAYWYHCSKPEGYYPYVKECPQGWEKVTPQPEPGK